MFYFKLSIADTDLHLITCFRHAGYNTAIVSSSHHRITARQNRVWIQRFQPALHTSDIGGLQLNMMEQRRMSAACQLVHALALRLDAALGRNISELRGQ